MVRLWIVPPFRGICGGGGRLGSPYVGMSIIPITAILRVSPKDFHAERNRLLRRT